MRIPTKLALLGLLGAGARIALNLRRRQGAPGAPPQRPAPTETPRPSAASDDTLVAHEEAAAAAEAAAIGGTVASQTDDPAMDPVYQAGGGEQEGFEAAEQDLIEAAEHGDSGADPLQDAFTAEVESDRSTAEYGDSDAVRSTEKADADSP